MIGEPGIGKTALIREAVGGPRPRTVWCVGDAMSQHRPFGLMLEGLALGNRQEAAESLLPLVTAGHVLAERLITEVGRRLENGPTVLVLDNVHLADEFTLDLLPRVADRHRSQPLLLLTAGESQLESESWRLSAALTRSCPSTELALRPLTLKESRALVSRILDQELGPDLDLLLASAGGNPLLLTRIAAALTGWRPDAGQPARTPRSLRLPMSQVPHLAYLSSECVGFLELASVLGRGFDTRQLTSVTGQPLARVIGLIREAIAAGVIEDDNGVLRFRHEIVRVTLAANLPSSLRSELHRSVAGDLADTEADPVKVVDHLVEATLAPPDFDWVHSVAVRCTSAAPDRALELWDHLLDETRLTDSFDPRRAEVESQMAMAQFSLGRVEEAEATARKALDTGVARDVSGLRTCLAMSLIIQGRPDEARSLAETSTGAADLQPWERAEQAALAALAAVMAGDSATSDDALDRAERAARTTGSSTALSRVLVTRGYDAHCRGDLHEANRLLGEAATLGVHEGLQGAQETFAHSILGLVLTDLDRVDEAQQVFHDGLRLSGARGLAIAERVTRSAQAWAAVSLGMLDVAAAAVDAELAQEAEQVAWWHPVQLAQRGLVALYRDGPEAAERWLRELETGPQPQEFGYGMAWRPRATAAVRLARGDFSGGLAVLWRGWTEVTSSGVLIDRTVLATDLVDAAIRAGDVAKAHAAVEGMDELAARNPDVGSLEVETLMLRGIITGDADTLVAAASAAGRLPRVMTSARAAEAAAIALARSGHAQRAHQLSRDAMAYYVQAGAGFEAARARAALRRAGIRLREPARTRPRSGWEALTPAEQVVARYVEQGLSNSDIADELVVSRRTVESHVSHILAKLDVRSRSDLILAAARMGRIPSQGGSPDVVHT